MRLIDWPGYKALALQLAADEALSHIEEAVSWGQPNLKAHGKMWCWWSPTEDAPVFKMDRAEREFLLEADPDTFFVTPHYVPHGLVLVRPAAFDADWARARLLKSWQDMAPKTRLKAWLAART
jgi:hypothetical protein